MLHDPEPTGRHCLDHDRAIQVGVTRSDVTMPLWRTRWPKAPAGREKSWGPLGETVHLRNQTVLPKWFRGGVLMLRRAVMIAFILGMLLQSPGREAQASSAKGALLQPVLEVLEKAKLSGSLEFTGNCDGGLPPDLPPLRTITGRGGSTLQTLREILRDDRAIRVEQDQTGRIRMVENAVPTDLLSIQIRHISFDGTYRSGPESGVYTPNQALYVIFCTCLNWQLSLKLMISKFWPQTPAYRVALGNGRLTRRIFRALWMT